ncbi:MAG: NADH-quinone oxidoreductase subunit L [Acidobacteria bacterium]|nr:NADH-quinone oxidoreductase subunit L [Acidobacteriota bacterium]MCG3195020.1 NADH-quinone oxidoreductase subunit L [Thermoanaerobaculia bacterium]MCK6681473.1 NADH-quinone oxidoreductase subunit L [Thermoanaerobaculia bacterium]
MKAETFLPWIPLFPFIGFLINGLLYLVSHSKMGDKDAPKGSHGHGEGHDSHGHDAASHDGHDSHGGGHGHGGHVDIPFKAVHSLVGPIASGLSCLFSLLAILAWWQETGGHHEIVVKLWTWVPAGENLTWFGAKTLEFDVAFRIDPLTALMIGFVSFIGTLIHVYSVGYMGHDEGYGRFFAYLNLFMFSMLVLVLGANLGILFVGWEGVGLCSYLLIGYYYQKDFAADAGKKAFVMNRIGDVGFILGLFACTAMFGTIDFTKMFEAAAKDPGTYAAGGAVTAACIALFIGACGKSAQIPLYVWLPDAMAGPTPVSALIHAATMVTAGVYMVARCNVLFRISHEWAVKTLGENASVFAMLTHDASYVVAVVGGVTAFFAATIGLAQTDIKKVLAYSTVSQLGYMFLGCGSLAFGAGMFHVFTHAWFKACLFLGSGSVIHALSGEQEMTRMGGLKNLVPHTYRTMFISTLAIAGVPFLSGFFSKDAILAETFINGHPILWALAVLTAGLTAFYMFRLVKMTFYGEFRGTKEELAHVHESPATMTIPLWILAGGAIVAGYLGIPKFILGKENAWEKFLEPIFPPLAAGWMPEPHHASHALEWGLMMTSVVVAGIGIALGWAFYSGAYPFATPGKIAGALPGLYRWVRNKYFVDEAYEWLFVDRLIKKFGRFLWEVDARFVDGAVNGSRHLTVGGAHVSSWFDKVFVDGAVNGVANVLQTAWRGHRSLQSGQTQGYALAMTFGIFGLVCIYLILS